MTDFPVRLARMDDAAPLFSAWQRLRSHNAEVDRRFIPAPITQEDFVSDLEQLLQRPQSATLVAECPGGIAGFISGRVERNQPDRLPELHVAIGYLWVDERYRRLGVASALFSAIAEWSRGQDGVAHFEMAVLGADQSAAAFWRSIGFVPFIERLWAPLSAPERDE